MLVHKYLHEMMINVWNAQNYSNCEFYSDDVKRLSNCDFSSLIDEFRNRLNVYGAQWDVGQTLTERVRSVRIVSEWTSWKLLRSYLTPNDLNEKSIFWTLTLF